MDEAFYHFTPGSAPLLVSMPHVGTEIPPAIADSMTDDARAVPDTDWHVDRLYDFLGDMDLPVIRARYSRYVVDLNRDAEGAALYPGQSETEVCPGSSFDHKPLYTSGQGVDPAEAARRIGLYWRPYHDRLRQELDRIRGDYGYALLWDAHSIRSVVPRFFAGQLPDLNIGTGGGSACAAGTAEAILAVGQASSYSTVLNGRFKGGYITRHYGEPAHNIQAVQMEISQTTYMEEDPPYAFDEAKAEILRPVLRNMMQQFMASAGRRQ
ncbi:N-formylglutamate deformylase [Emcibacter nanhaiensis]|uniref:N-formylglutamate deformylase n=2 Tax=Emcibacter nanhaiensis TaxID=1505037 RepID=A0A501PFP9_9PROT|nr:N-formylglutamate deformylase [Emcibacter nanhaiensis]TPD59253.1 N-formylglutamate deformylase [Emcibacter nanhaiensis]